jgi:hypothetical protein
MVYGNWVSISNSNVQLLRAGAFFFYFFNLGVLVLLGVFRLRYRSESTPKLFGRGRGLRVRRVSKV